MATEGRHLPVSIMPGMSDVAWPWPPSGVDPAPPSGALLPGLPVGRPLVVAF
jgi:hypothetical protein